MKITYSKTIILLIVLSVVITAGIFIFRPKDDVAKEAPKPEPIVKKQSQPAQTEPTAKPEDIQQLKVETASKPEAKPAQTQTRTLTEQKTFTIRQSTKKSFVTYPTDYYDSEGMEEDYDQPEAVTMEPNSTYSDYRLLDDPIQPTELTPTQQRHQERYRLVEKELRPVITPEQAEQMRKEMISRLPEKYRKIIEDLEKMKEAERQKRRMQSGPESMLRPANKGYYKSTSQALESRLYLDNPTDEGPRFTDAQYHHPDED